MFYIIEALVVGLYTTLIYYLFSLLNINLNIFILLFLIGFLKHFFGYYIGLHYYYCNYSEKCKNVIINNHNNNDNNKNKYNSNSKLLLIDSIYEGLIFIYFGSILKIIINNKIVLFYILGFFIHILSEFIGYHKYFCINKCKKMIN